MHSLACTAPNWRLRPVRAHDTALLDAFFRNLASESRRRRLHRSAGMRLQRHPGDATLVCVASELHAAPRWNAVVASQRSAAPVWTPQR